MVSINAFKNIQKGKKISFSQKRNHSPYYLHKLRKIMLLEDWTEKRGKIHLDGTLSDYSSVAGLSKFWNLALPRPSLTQQGDYEPHDSGF